jgi:hypothetical protein
LLLCSCKESENANDAHNAEEPGIADWHITIDQFGYRTGDDKVAVIVNPQTGFNKDDHFTPGNVYQLRRVSDDSVVFTGKPAPWNNGQTDNAAGDKAWWFDFSAVSEPGTYYVYDEKKALRSYNFRIADNVYEKVLYDALRMFYYQREGMAHEAPYAEYPWHDAAAWTGPGQDAEARDVLMITDESRKRDVSGGWMDAGDTNKYVTFVDSCVHDLLSTYESNPGFFRDFNLNIPESHLNAPDILSEIKWEMDWLIKMQNEDGSAYMKSGMQKNDAVSPPSQDATPRVYLGKKSSAAAIAIAGMFAHGALSYKTIDLYRGYGDELGKKAEKAWEWYIGCLNNNARTGGDLYDASVDIGVDKVDNGEIRSGIANRSLKDQDMLAVAAAVYLYALTNKTEYHDYIKTNYSLLPPMQADLSNHRESGFINFPRQLGLAYIYYMGLPNADASVANALKGRYTAVAENTSVHIPHQFMPEKSAYRAYVSPNMFFWGGHQYRAARGYDSYLLSELNLIPSMSGSFRTMAANQLHYFHGVNPFGMTFLTNMRSAGASKSVTWMYHEWFMDIPGPPGYLVGGPNPDWPTGSTKLTPPDGQPPMKCYFDAPHNYKDASGRNHEWWSYAYTEPMCNYQGAYVRLLACFAAKIP